MITGGTGINPRTILRGLAGYQEYDPGRGQVLVAGALNKLPNLGGAGTNDAASAIADCAYSAAGGPNGRSMFSTSATTGTPTAQLATGLNQGTPGTTPSFAYLIARVDTDRANCFLLAAGASGTRLQSNGNGTFFAYNGTVGASVALVAGTWCRIWVKFSNSAVTDELRIGAATSGTGTSFGNGTTGAPFRFGGTPAGATNALSASFGRSVFCQAVPSAVQIAALDTYFNSQYGGAVAF